MPPENEIHPDKRNVPITVDRTDWLKTAAIIFVSIDHFGYFFMEDDLWWAAIGRLAAPVFFFLLGYAKTRTVPIRWIWLGVGLTLLDSWNNDWVWVAPNILLSLAFIRFVRPWVQSLLEDHGWVAFALLVSVLVVVLPIAGDAVDYGSEGWLWALFGLCQRTYVDGKSSTGGDATAGNSTPPIHAPSRKADVMRMVACFVAAIIYIWQERIEFPFSQTQLAVVILGVAILALGLCVFKRGPSRIQPHGVSAAVLTFVGRHTLEIYAIQLAGSELLVRLVPGLAP